MKKITTVIAALSAAAVATMLTFAPASAAGYGKKQHYSHGYEHNHGKSAYWKWQKRRHARNHHHHHHADRHWKPRNHWKYAYRPYRNW